MGAVLCAGLAMNPVKAAEVVPETGLEVSMETDKEAYGVSDHIIVNVTVTNTEDSAVDHISIKNDTLNGYKLVDGSSDLFRIDSLQAGETKTVSTEFEAVPVVDAGTSNNDSNDEDDDDSHHSSTPKTENTVTANTAIADEVVPLASGVDEVNTAGEVTIAPENVPLAGAPKTGDNNNMIYWSMLLLFSTVAGVTIIRNRKEIRKYLSLVIVLTVAGVSVPAMGLHVNAAEASGQSMQMSKNITVDGQTKEVVSHVYIEVEFIGGTVVNALNNNHLENVTVKLREGNDNQTGDYVKNADGTDVQAVTSESGYYQLDDIAAGSYTAEYIKDGYITGYKNVVCSITSGHEDMALSPVMSGDTYRIVLTWGENPSDLDSHLEGTANGEHGHVYYSDKNFEVDGIEIANLDLDDITSYGPETITINELGNDEFQYYVKNFTNRGEDANTALSASSAQVSVYRGSSLIKKYSVPENQTGLVWSVFELDAEGIHDVNKVGNEYGEEIDENAIAEEALEMEALAAPVTAEEVTITEETTEETETTTEETETATEETETNTEDTESTSEGTNQTEETVGTTQETTDASTEDTDSDTVEAESESNEAVELNDETAETEEITE